MHKSRFEIVADIAGAEDWEHDPYGTAVALHFDIASVLDMSDIEGDVSPEPFDRWEYRRAPFTVPAIETVAARAADFNEGEFSDDYSYAEIALAVAVRDGQLSQADLIFAGDVCSRYARMLDRAGRSY